MYKHLEIKYIYLKAKWKNVSSELQKDTGHRFPTPVFSQVKQCSHLWSHKILYPAIFVSSLNSTLITSLFGVILLHFFGYEIIFST